MALSFQALLGNIKLGEDVRRFIYYLPQATGQVHDDTGPNLALGILQRLFSRVAAARPDTLGDAVMSAASGNLGVALAVGSPAFKPEVRCVVYVCVRVLCLCACACVRVLQLD
jgi:hypothetical protein